MSIRAVKMARSYTRMRIPRPGHIPTRLAIGTGAIDQRYYDIVLGLSLFLYLPLYTTYTCCLAHLFTLAGERVGLLRHRKM